jgi:hypothetical protein
VIRSLRWPAAALSLLAALSPACGPRPAAAAITPGARTVVERYVAAIGGRAFVDSLHSLAVHGALSAFGMRGSVLAWHQRPQSSASEVQIGPLKIAEGCDGDRAWRTDPSGKLVVLDGKDLEEARADAWFENDRWLEPDQGGGTVAEAGPATDSSGTYTVLEVTPPIGRAHRLWFDDRTGRLARTVSSRDQKTITVADSDYRPVAGGWFAFESWTRIEGMAANDLHLTLDSVAVNPVVPAARFAAPATVASGPRWLRRDGIARLPFEYASRHVWLKVSVDGSPPADFLFDTGASVTVLDSAFAARHGIATVGRQQGVGAGATGAASFASVRSLRVAAPDSDGVEVADLNVAVIALRPFLEPYFWREVGGVIGFDFIQRFVDEIDYDHRTLTLHDPKTFSYAGKGTAIPMTLAGATPVVAMKLDRTLDGLYRVDVGSGATVDLHTPFVKQHRLDQGDGARVEITGGGFGGTFRSTARRMQRLDIGPFGWDQPIVALSQATEGAFTSEDYAGNIGNQILERFRCTFDYERRVLYLEPGARYAEPDAFPRSGVQLARFGGRVVAFAVLKDSPAARAGMLEDDQLITIDGRPVEEWTPDAVAETLDRGKPGSTHTVEVARGDRRLRLELKLRDLL